VYRKIAAMTKFTSSLRFRLIVLVLLAVIPAFGVILFSAARYRDLTADQVQRNALTAARIIAAEQERVLENAHQLLITMARLPQIRDHKSAPCSRILAGLLEPLYADLGVADLKGNIVCSALGPKSSLAQISGAYFNRVLETHDFSIGHFRTLPATGKTLVDVGYPVTDSPGSLRAVVFGVVDISWLTRITAKNHLEHEMAFTLFDGSGTVLFRYPEENDWLGKRIFAEPALEGSVVKEPEGTIESTGPDGARRLFAFSQLKKQIGERAVYAAVDIPVATAFAKSRRILILDLILLALLSAVTLIAAWFGADVAVLRRINDLANATRQLAAGNLNARTRLPYGKSELGLMAKTFDHLALTLAQREIEAKASSEQIDRQRQRQSALHDINLAITSSLDLASVLEALLKEIADLFPEAVVRVSWVNRQAGKLELMAQRNPFEHEPTVQPGAEIEEGLPQIVIKNRSRLAVSNGQTDHRTANPEFFRRYRLFSFLGIPMIAKGEALGVLSFYQRDKQGFREEEMDFLTTLAHQASLVIYNSMLYEQTRNQAIELEKSNKTKDEFLGVMSHELRTPLNVIMNYTECMTTGMFGELSADQRKATEKIGSQAIHLLALINGILEITKIETGTVVILKEPLDVREFAAEMQSDYMAPMERGLALTWQVPTEPQTITSDRLKLKQILTNLINNAIKFTNEGVITVTIQVIERGKVLEMTVADTGAGIPEEKLSTIFDKFRQIDSTTTRNHSGAGLGLYIVKTFVELLEGTVTVQSKVGEGSKFTVRVPVELRTSSAGYQTEVPKVA
jgi:signal transduction histidine kinase/HAMP domain-containing protein